jgi:hypothetical protein
MAPRKLAGVSGDTNAAVLNERMRIAAIVESAEGKRNPELATELALRSSLDVDTARALLSKVSIGIGMGPLIGIQKGPL